MVKDPVEFERRRQAYIDRKWAKKGAEARKNGTASLGPNSAPANRTLRALGFKADRDWPRFNFGFGIWFGG